MPPLSPILKRHKADLEDVVVVDETQEHELDEVDEAREEREEAERVYLDLDETMVSVNDQHCPKCKCMVKTEERGCQTD